MKARTNLNQIDMGQTFHCIDPISHKTVRARKEEDTVFVFGPHCTKTGARYSGEYFSKKYHIVPPKTKTDQWHSRIRRALKAMDASKMWNEHRQFLENLLTMTWEDRQEMLFLKLKHKPGTPYVKKDWQKWIDKYPFIATEENGQFLPNLDYICHTISRVELTSMFFGEENSIWKAKIETHFKDKTTLHLRQSGKYEVAFHYYPEAQKAYYEEESRKSGDTSYYLALDKNVAWLMEKEIFSF